MPFPLLAALAAAAPIAGDITKGWIGNQNATRDRRALRQQNAQEEALAREKMAQDALLTHEQMAQKEKNDKFQRLLLLTQQSQGMMNQGAGVQRLLSLRNAGRMP